MRWISWSVLVCCITVSLADAGTIHVPGDQPTIQAGIDAAFAGDTVLVAEGVYTGPGNLEVSSWGKPITLRSENGPASTTIVYYRFIDGTPYARCFFFVSGEGSTTSVEGFTFTDSAEYLPTEGRAVMLMQSSPAFRNCIFTGFNAGSPIACDNASPIFDSCTFAENTGGCSECKENQSEQSSPWLGRASVVRCSNQANAIFRNCDFIDNVADVAQGAIVCNNSSPVLTNCRFVGNKGYYAHAAVAVIGNGSNPAFQRCTLEATHSEGVNRSAFAGAIYLHAASATFTDCVFDSSTTYGASGKIYAMAIFADTGSTATITGCSFTRNYADTVTGWSAVAAGTSATVTIDRSLIALNHRRPPVGRTDSTAQLLISCTNIYNNAAGDWFGDVAPDSGVAGNLSADPLFCNPAAPSDGLYDVSPCHAENNGCSLSIGAITVACVDQVPAITSVDSIAVIENEQFIHVISFVDPDGPDTSITLSGVPSWCSFAADTLSGTPGDNSGDTGFTVIVSDGYRADTQAVYIDVFELNDSPVLDSLPELSVDEGQLLTLYVSASDPDNIPRLTAENLPAGASFVDSGNGTAQLTWTPDYERAGLYEVLIIAFDDSLMADSQIVTITVIDVNRAPYIGEILPVHVFIGDTLQLPVVATDQENDSILLAMIDLPGDAVFVDSGNGVGVLSFAADSTLIGSYSILIVAADISLADTAVLLLSVVDTIPALANVTFDGESDLLHVLNHLPIIRWVYTDTNQAAVQTAFEVAVGHDSDWIGAAVWNPASIQSTDQSIVFGGLPPEDGASYSLGLRTHNSRVWSDWFVLPFRMNTAPYPPTLLSPIDEAYSSEQPVLWLAGEPDAESDSLTFEFAVGADSTLSGPENLNTSGISQTSDSTGWTVPEILDENTQYFWKARAFDGFEYSPWSDASAASFWVNATHEPPEMPRVFSIHPDTCALTELLPTFTWTSSIDPDPLDTVSYRIHLAIDAGFESAVVTETASDTIFAPADSLLFATRYWWKVTAEDNTGNVTESPAESFWTWTLGDVDNNHSLNVGDLTSLVGHLFRGEPSVCEEKTADINGDCKINVSDLTFLVNLLFKGGDPARIGCAG